MSREPKEKPDENEEYVTQEELDELIASTSEDLGTRSVESHDTAIIKTGSGDKAQEHKTAAFKTQPGDKGREEEAEKDKRGD